MTDLCLGQVSWTGRIPKAMVCIEKQERNCGDRDSKTVYLIITIKRTESCDKQIVKYFTILPSLTEENVSVTSPNLQAMRLI